MGYRSDVALCLTSSGVGSFNKALAGIKASGFRNELQALFDAADSHFADPDTGADLWAWTGIKWYPDYEDVGFIETFLNNLCDEDYLFIRIGESDDDSEILGSFHDNPFGMYLSRTIEFEQAGEKP